MKPSCLTQRGGAEEGRLGVIAGALNNGAQDTAHRHGVIKKEQRLTRQSPGLKTTHRWPVKEMKAWELDKAHFRDNKQSKEQASNVSKSYRKWKLGCNAEW